MLDETLSQSEELTVWPTIISNTSHDNVVEIALNIPKDLHYFKGHFTDAPILAGVVQLHWAVEYANKAFSLTGLSVKNVEVLKFQVVIVPGQNLLLTLTQKSNDKILFAYESDKGKHSSGRIVFEGAA